jgi:hypothetical protein
VHLHQREDDTIFIRMGSGLATLGDRQIPVTAGAIIYVPQQRLGPDRTQAEIEAERAKYGIVYRTP